MATFLAAAPAAAQLSENDERARRLFEAGTVLYETGEYERALEQFEAAYELSHRPVLHYNIALARERMGDMEGALSAFEEFLAANVEAPNINRDSLERRVVALRRRIERRQAEGATANPSGQEHPTVPTPAEVAQQASGTSGPLGDTGGGDDGVIIGVTIGAVAAALVAVAIVIAVVLATPGEEPYNGTLFSRSLP